MQFCHITNAHTNSCQKPVTEMTRSEMKTQKPCDLDSLWKRNNSHTPTQWPRQWTHPCDTHTFKTNVSRHTVVAVTISSVCVCVW